MTTARPALYIASNQIGDCVLASGVIRELGRETPGCEITVACGRHAAPLFRSAPGVTRIIILDKKTAGGHWLDLWKAAIGTRWGTVVDIRGSAIAWLLRADRRRVYSRKFETGGPKVETISAMMRAGRTLEPELFLDAAAHADAAAILGDDAGRIIALAPIASVEDRSWPADRWGALVETLKAEPRFAGWRFMLVGGPGDREAAASALKAAGPDAVDFVGKGDIQAAAAAIARATLFVGNDSGLMHIAAAAGTPTLGLFGPSEWWLKAPWGPKGRIITAGETQDQPLSIQRLGVDRVVQAVLALHHDFIGPDAVVP
ncbi:glycosyltransferase family 9 protein [soil metagenome]